MNVNRINEVLTLEDGVLMKNGIRGLDLVHEMLGMNIRLAQKFREILCM
jgi:hypothetical protein